MVCLVDDSMTLQTLSQGMRSGPVCTQHTGHLAENISTSMGVGGGGINAINRTCCGGPFRTEYCGLFSTVAQCYSIFYFNPSVRGGGLARTAQRCPGHPGHRLSELRVDADGLYQT